MEAAAEGTPRKVGLALSGGGFRAAFFHVGVLARLAETGLLREVEVISTVSGGSIVGAAYYILLKEKLETTRDGEIGPDGYVELVAELEALLREAVQQNIRARVFGNLLKNLGMALSPGYSRSDRIGDLYDRFLFKRAWSAERPRKWRGFGPQRQIGLSELRIEPFCERGFHPESGNATRKEKVPILLINATSLNSGHNWRFEAVCMGESLPEDPARAASVEEVDKNMRLERGYFDPAPPGKLRVPDEQQDFPLGLAVAASACVPGVFQPLAITGMYGRDVRVQLVDGGVQDNQGVQGLFDKCCTHLIVSDASGQMDDLARPSARLPGVVGRSGSIARDRVRDEQLADALRGPPEQSALMHLRKGLPVAAVMPGGALAETTSQIPEDFDTTDFGVNSSVQRALSKVRTDLDLFGDVEASALELDGYRMSAFELQRRGMGALDGEPPPADPSRWRFGAQPLLGEVAAGEDPTRKVLLAARRRFFRFAWLRPWLGIAVGALLLAALAAAFYALRGTIGDAVGHDVPAGLLFAALLLVAAFGAGYALDPRWPPLKLVVEIVMAAVLLAAAAPLFLWSQLSTLTTRARYRA